MFITDVVLTVFRSGQPALLYLVPSTLGLTVALAHRKGHLHDMWDDNAFCHGHDYSLV